MLLVFCVSAGLMMARRVPALLALPAMGVAIGLLAGLHHGLNSAALFDLLVKRIVTEGSVAMARAMVVAFAGGALAQMVMFQGISQALVGRAAEYAGDRQLPLTFAMLLVVVINFTALSGVGAILMLGHLVLPILVGAGVPPRQAGVVMLFGIAIGGLVNPLALQIYSDLIHVPLQRCVQLSWSYLVLLALSACAYVWRNMGRSNNFAWAAEVPPIRAKLGFWPMLTPVLPLLMMGPLGLPPLVAILAALLYGSLVVRPKDCLANLTRAAIEGIREVAPMVALFVGLGIALEAINHPYTREVLTPILQWGAPRGPVAYVLCFSLLAPLAAYRGPLTLYGLGAGVAALLVQVLPATAVLAAFLCLGQFQSICDPTCTHAVCVGQIVGEAPERLAWSAAPYVWGFVTLGLSLAVSFQAVLN
jgi:hypothetical protein